MFITILVLIGIIVVGYFFNKYRTNKMINEINISNAKEYAYLSNELKEQITKNGKLIATNKTLELDKKGLKQQLISAGFKIDSLNDVSGNYKNIINILQAELKASGSGSVIIKPVHDTTYVYDIPDYIKKIHDGPLFFDFSLSQLQNTNDLKFDYNWEIYLKLNFYHHYQRDKWYQAKYPVITAESPDQRVQFINLKDYAVKDNDFRINPWLTHGIAFVAGGASIYFIGQAINKNQPQIIIQK